LGPQKIDPVALADAADLSPSARLPPAIPTEVSMRLIGLAVILAVSLTFAPLAR